MSRSPIHRWRDYYRPPWPFLLQVVLVIVVFIAFITIFYPSVRALHDVRLMLVTLMFADSPDNVPFSSIGDLEDAVDDYLDAIENLSDNSLLDFYFTDPEHPVESKVIWRNGSTTVAPIIDINLSYIDHIIEFDIASDFMIVSTDSDLIGCTRWTSCLTVGLRPGSYLFSILSTLTRSNCTESVIGQVGSITPRSSEVNIKDRLKKLEIEGGVEWKPSPVRLRSRLVGHVYRAISAAPQVVPPTFDRKTLTVYGPMARYGMIILSLSFVHFILMLMTLGRSFMYHSELILTDPEYYELSAYEQFHTVIGFWTPISLITSIASMIAGSCMIYNVEMITQFPSQTVCIAFGVASLLAIVTSVRYLKRVPHCYAVVLVIRQALGRFIMLLLILAPFIAGLVFLGIFMFGFVSFHSENALSLLRVMLSITFGDNILPTYGEFTDDSPIYNLLSFIYVTILTAMGMWIFFTLFTAETVAIFESQITPLLQYSRRGENA